MAEELLKAHKTRRNVWWVNQGDSLDNERAGGYIWAPVKGRDGRSVVHWESLKETQEDDLVLHHAKGILRYVSQVISQAVKTNDDNGVERYLVRVNYYELIPPIPYENFVDRLAKLRIEQGPTDRNGKLNQGYLFRLTPDALRIIQESQPNTN